MTQIFLPTDLDNNQQKVYCYINQKSYVVVAKIKCLKSRHCERVVFPGQKFLFMADDECNLEIHQQIGIDVVKDVISCAKLPVIEEQSRFSTSK